MKKIYIMAVLAVLVAVPAMALVSGTKHDMVASGFAAPESVGGSTEVCIFCHTPHGAQAAFTQVPLWNNTPSADLVLADMYSSSTMNFTVSEAQINATDARLCLACHDGGVGEPINQPNSGIMVISEVTLMSSDTLLGTNLSNDHPIGMNLTANPENVDVQNGVAGMHTLNDIIADFGGENPFFGDVNTNTMWCSTCHDVHDNPPLKVPFLRISNVGSALCKACHIK